jgi:transposase
MGPGCRVPHPLARGKPPTPPLAARSLQCHALDGARRSTLAALSRTSFRPGPPCTSRRERWIAAGVFEALVHDLRAVLRLAADRAPQPSAVVLDARTLQSSCESGGRAGYDGAKRRRGSKVHMAVDTLGQLLALRVTPANEDDRAQVGEVIQAVQDLTGQTVELAYVDQGYTGETAAAAAAQHGVKLEVVKLPQAKRGFVLLPRRWVVERSFGWMARFRRLARDYERLPTTLAGLHFIAFACLLLARVTLHFQTC